MALDSIAFRPRAARRQGRRVREPVRAQAATPVARAGGLTREPSAAGANRWCAGRGVRVRAHAQLGANQASKTWSRPRRCGHQLYVRGDAPADHVARALDHGYAAFALNSRHRALQPARVTSPFRHRWPAPVQNRVAQASLDWRTVERIKKKIKIPLAGRASPPPRTPRLGRAGVDWIYVSNHGGRLDRWPRRLMCCPPRGRRPRQDHRRRSDLPRHRHRQGDRDRRRPVGIGRMQCWRWRAAAEGRAAAARTARGRSAVLPAPRRSELRRPRPLLPARRRAANIPHVLSAFPCSRSTIIGTECRHCRARPGIHPFLQIPSAKGEMDLRVARG